MKRAHWRRLLLLVLFVFLTACSPEKNGVLTIYAGLYDDHAIKAIEAFQKETGIKVSYLRMSSGEILARIRAERDKPRTSVWYGGPADTFIQAKTEGLLTPYISVNSEWIDEAYKDEEGYWAGIYLGSLALVSNKAWLQEVGLSPPQSWNDLLNPKYKGMIGMPDPRTSGTGYTVLATLVQLWGEEQAFSYFKEIHQQINTYTTSGSVPGRKVGMGEIGTAIMFSHDAIKFYKEGFRDIIVGFPEEGTGYEIGAIGIINGAPNQNEAERFVDWALTKQAQELGKQVGNYQLLTNREAVSPAEAFPLANLTLIPYDHSWAGNNRERLLTKWANEVLN
ncbi:ABC transporter substrate-binding protein [Paenibacillus sp. J2TS4]|uniref:ABC transporter substrate-binding protein n=1 Tax=Paenibacillus sp. J2TS4 TaxID=2807194 RepID=UPI001B0B1B79|nr:ABC transporter substrate-binding protein [Paenibacillus sp. J2TS4]GIP35102.1 hypothetical protein J2TS4_43120 [Paenibacillus sp. J2TS4]